MRAVVQVNAFQLALKRLAPKTGRYKSLAEPIVELMAGGDSIIVTGTLASSASLPARVVDAGKCQIPLASTIRVLGTYPKGSEVEIHGSAGRFVIDKMALVVPVSE